MAGDDAQAGSAASGAEEWSARAVGAVDQALDVVHDKVVRPALLAGRAVVFGVVVAVVTLVILVLLVIAVVRLLDVYAFSDRVWASDALFGVVLCVAGFVVWSRRTRRSGR
jgi:hypothetical protein